MKQTTQDSASRPDMLQRLGAEDGHVRGTASRLLGSLGRAGGPTLWALIQALGDEELRDCIVAAWAPPLLPPGDPWSQTGGNQGPPSPKSWAALNTCKVRGNPGSFHGGARAVTNLTSTHQRGTSHPKTRLAKQAKE